MLQKSAKSADIFGEIHALRIQSPPKNKIEASNPIHRIGWFREIPSLSILKPYPWIFGDESFFVCL